MPFFAQASHRLFYRTRGGGPLLLILPGNTASSAHHAGELEHFGQCCHAVAPDFWGTGQSDRITSWPDDWYERAADDMAALIAHFGEEAAFVMGTSGGSVVALLLAIRHPAAVRALIADSCDERLPASSLEALAADRARRSEGQIAFWRHAHGEDWAQVVEQDTAMLLRTGKRSNWFGGRLGEVRCPVLFTVSLGDELLPDPAGDTCHMVAQIPTSRALVFPAGSHPLMWSRPDDFREAADHFLALQGAVPPGTH